MCVCLYCICVCVSVCVCVCVCVWPCTCTPVCPWHTVSMSLTLWILIYPVLNVQFSVVATETHTDFFSPVKPYTSIPLSRILIFRCEDTCTGSWIVYLNCACMLVCVHMCAWASVCALYSTMCKITCCKWYTYIFVFLLFSFAEKIILFRFFF